MPSSRKSSCCLILISAPQISALVCAVSAPCPAPSAGPPGPQFPAMPVSGFSANLMIAQILSVCSFKRVSAMAMSRGGVLHFRHGGFDKKNYSSHLSGPHPTSLQGVPTLVSAFQHSASNVPLSWAGLPSLTWHLGTCNGDPPRLSFKVSNDPSKITGYVWVRCWKPAGGGS